MASELEPERDLILLGLEFRGFDDKLCETARQYVLKLEREVEKLRVLHTELNRYWNLPADHDWWQGHIADALARLRDAVER